jgi:hypothetical protein
MLRDLWRVYWPLSGILAGAIIVLAVARPLPSISFWLLLVVCSVVIASTRYIAERAKKVTAKIQEAERLHFQNYDGDNNTRSY